MSTRFQRALLTSLAVAASTTLACSEDPLVSHSTTSASSTGSGACVTPGTTCGVVFAFPLGDAKSVELRGDFSPDGWTKGIPLEIDQGEWRVTVSLADQATVHYKFFVDGVNYVTDPNNPDQEDDGFGGKNSI
jgi:hypothetical protein